jgi:hypothetical protein
MILAPGVEFIEDKHEYWYKGKQLSGVTGLISKKLGLKMPQEFVEEHQMEGTHVHKAVQKWIETGDPESIHPGVEWLTSTFYNHYPDRVATFAVFSEVLVSDFSQYASSVDIVASLGNAGLVDIFDIKKGRMNRQYVTYQLNIYRYFIERYAQRKVRNMVCISLRDREYYDIFPKNVTQVEKLLYA